jgi:hypothetical protein
MQIAAPLWAGWACGAVSLVVIMCPTRVEYEKAKITLVFNEDV